MTAGLSQLFLDAANDWLVEGGSLQVRYLATVHDSGTSLMGASVVFGPRKLAGKSTDFMANAGSVLGGQKTFPSISKARALSILRDGMRGELDIDGMKLHLTGVSPQAQYSEMLQRDRWQGDLHLQVTGERTTQHVPSSQTLLEDNSLRVGTPPFDGLTELAQALGLSDTRSALQSPSVNIRIGIPVDFILDSGKLGRNHLDLAFIAHRECERRRISVAIRAFPGAGLQTRLQVAPSLTWKRAKDGLRAGALSIDIENADSVIVILSYANQLVRRHWFVDPEKATNTRLVAVQAYDRELKQLRQSLLESTDSARFERAIGALLFLLGFAPSPVLETQAPDIILATPSGALAIVECTTRISDFSAKVGKLVDRRQALTSQLEANGHSMQIQAFLVTSQIRAQVASEEARTTALRITLLTREDIVEGLSRTRWPGNPDKLLEDAARTLSAQSSIGL